MTGFNLFAYCGNNPVKGFDPTGHWDWGGVIVGASLFAAGVITLASCGTGTPVGVMIVAAAVATTGAITTGAAATDSTMVVDVSTAAAFGTGTKIGASLVVDFENNNANFYTHTGAVGQNSFMANASYSVGIVSNYTEPEDYAGPFADINGGIPMSPVYSVGLDHCWNPQEDPRIATKATSFTFATGVEYNKWSNYGVGIGYDRYSKPTQILAW